MADFLDEKRKEIQARLKELKPLVEEYTRLEAAERALSGVGTNGASSRTRACVPSTPRRRRTPQLGSRPPRPPARQRHPRGAGVRAGEGPPGHHDPRARRRDGDQAELPVSRHAHPRGGGQGHQERPRAGTPRGE